jgi:hypothetical protein
LAAAVAGSAGCLKTQPAAFLYLASLVLYQNCADLQQVTGCFTYQSANKQTQINLGTSGEEHTQLCLATTLSADSTLPVLQPKNGSLLANARERFGHVSCQT